MSITEINPIAPLDPEGRKAWELEVRREMDATTASLSPPLAWPPPPTDDEWASLLAGQSRGLERGAVGACSAVAQRRLQAAALLLRAAQMLGPSVTTALLRGEK